VKAIYF